MIQNDQRQFNNQQRRSEMKTTQEILDQAEELKQEIWARMEYENKEHKGIKELMNELLDLIEELDL